MASRKNASKDSRVSENTKFPKNSRKNSSVKYPPSSKNPVAADRKRAKRKSSQKPSLAVNLPPGIEVKLCDYGRGVFVTQAFPPEAVVGEVSGEIITSKGYGSQNCMDLGRHGVLEPSPPFQFLNHSCDPNCELLWEIARDPQTGKRRPRVYVQTLRAIEPGEQLTLDYAWPAEEAIPCQCSSTFCRGWVVAEEELHLIPETLAV